MSYLPTMVLVALGLAALSAPTRAATLYVSTAGDDANDGGGPEPNRALRTIQAAVDRLEPGDTCLVLGGVYRETVVFHRSGEPDRPLVVRPYENQQVVITGCDPVTDWSLHDPDHNIWKAPMPWTLGLGRNQVFAAGEVMIEARFPNEPAPGLGMYVSDLSPLWPTFGEFSIENPKEDPGRIVSPLLEGQPDNYWQGACYYGVHYEGWCAQTGVIESSKSGEIHVGDRTRTWWFGAAYGGGYKPEEGRGMIVGHYHALDRPGEWCWQDDTLYLIPKSGATPSEVEAKRRQLAFDLSGQEHIRLEGLTIRAASLRLENSAWCVVERCDLAYISHYTRHHSIGQIEDGRDTIRSGETGIFVGGHDNQFLSCSVRISAGAGFHLRGYHHSIHNCLIDEVSYTAHYLNAITDAVSDFGNDEHFLVGGHVITYNTMRNAGRHFFNFHGNGTSTASRDRGPMDYMATLFAHNHLYNGMLQTKDAGLITGYYCSGGTLCGLNSQVVYNAIHESYDLAAMRWGVLGLVYLDAGTCDVDLHHNLLWAAPGSLQRGLWYNTMCVDIREHDNLFHPDFTRTSAELTAADFPDRRPFRFGHDFDNPPPLPRWPQLERRDIAASPPAEGLVDGVVLDLGEVDLDPGWSAAFLRYAGAVREVNSDRTGRASPRHRKATDPLVLEVAANEGLADGIRRQWTFMYHIADGAWVKFGEVPLGEGYRRFRIVYGNDQPAARSVEVHLDSVDGPLVGRAELPQTDRARGGRIQIYGAVTCPISETATGTHDVFLVFRSPDEGLVGEFEYFRFEQYRGRIPLWPNETRLELRLDAPTGELVGTFFPRSTGDPNRFREVVASLEPATGRRRLFLTVRSAYAGPVGAIDGLTLVRAAEPIDWTGVGEPPLLRNGKPVFPEPTHRPCARPGDRFPAARAGGLTPRPIAFAQATGQPPAIDGRLDDWPDQGPRRTLLLAENYDGGPTPASPSQAWLAYDAEALYVAMRHPVGNAAALLPSSHDWGAVDGAEIAFRTLNDEAAVLTLYGYPDGTCTAADYGGAGPAEIARLNAAVTYAAVVSETEWSCEWRIPFSACGFGPADAPLWAFNLGVRKTAPDGWAIWRGTGGATWRVGAGGLLAFPTELVATGLPTERLAVHLDAAAADSLELDADGRVAVWRDRGGAGRDAKQADPQYRPTYRADGLNGLPAVEFTEQRRTRLELPDLADEQINATVFAVISNPVAGSEVNHDPRIFTASDGREYDYLVGIAATVPGMQTGGPRVAVWTFQDAWAKVVRVGCFSPAYQTYFTGAIAEILVYERVVPPVEQERIRALLTAKWSLW